LAGITEVPFDRPRVPDLQHSAEFQSVVRRVRKYLEAEV
jgi:hypothetical protein